MKLTTGQREVLRALAAKGYPVKIGMHSGWNTRTMETLERAGLVALERRAHEERGTRTSVATWVSDGTWASITDAGRAAVAT